MKTPFTPFKPAAYVASKFATVKDKERFAKQFVKLVEGGFRFEDFPKWFYDRLTMCFGHIAHYNQGGFYDTRLRTIDTQIDFVEQTLNWPCYGEPEYTYSDVERDLRTWLRASKVHEALLQSRRRPLWERDEVQFPRLLCEIAATQDKLDLAALAESMDLSVEDVNALFDRASTAWEEAKRKAGRL